MLADMTHVNPRHTFKYQYLPRRLPQQRLE